MSTPRRQQPKSSVRARITVPCVASLVAAAALLLASCAENTTEPTDPTNLIQPLTDFAGTVSEPIARNHLAASSTAPATSASAGSDLAVSSAASDSVSYVSLEPGSLPEADSVQIVNLASGASVSVPVVDGGFDPVMIPATVGDTLEIVPFKDNAPQPAFKVLVPPRRPPVVVRTDPPNRKTKVPLNTSAVVVFSEPMDSGTITLGNLRLLKEGQLVPAEVTLDPEGLRAVLRPESPLSYGFEYMLSIGTGVTDRSGDPLEQATVITFSTISGPTPVQLTAGRSHTCGLTAEGHVYCWGSNEYGQLGDGAGGAGVRQPPIRVAGGHTFTMLAAGTYHTCGLTVTGAVLCWGRNDQGQLGDGSQADHDAPAQIAGSEVYVAVTAGLNHTCARSATDTYCWGQNVDNVLGDFMISLDPRRVDTRGGLTWAPIDYLARRDTIYRTNWCPILIWDVFANGYTSSFCWGQPPEGRAALDLATLSIPYEGGQFPRVADLAIDADTRCAVTVGGGAHCDPDWFFVEFPYENGLGVEVCVGATCSVRGFDVSYWFLRNWPNEFTGTSIVVSGQLHSCALNVDGIAYCWGAADRGQVGRTPDQCCLITSDLGPEAVAGPGAVRGFLNFATLAAGEYHTCGVTQTGETYCWGANGFGQLGDGTETDRDRPARVTF